MSAQPANDDGVDRGDQQHPVICAAPSCWEEGEAIEIIRQERAAEVDGE